MRKLFQIFAKMTESNIPYFFQDQRQPHGNRFFNISFEDKKGETQMFHERSLDAIEKVVEIHWGHLIGSVATPSLPKMTLPPLPGFPKP